MIVFGAAFVALIALQVIWITGSYQKERQNWNNMILNAVRQTEMEINAMGHAGSTRKNKNGESISGSATESLLQNNPLGKDTRIVGYTKSLVDSSLVTDERAEPAGQKSVIDSVMEGIIRENKIAATYRIGTDSGSVQTSDALIFALAVPDREGTNGQKEFLIGFKVDGGSIFRRMGWVIGANILILVILSIALFYTMSVVYRQREVYQMRKSFIDNLTHDFKTPVANVSLALEGLIQFDIRKNPEKSVKYLQIAQIENRRLSLMVEKVLNLAAFEKGKIQITRAPVDVHELIRETVQVFDVQVRHLNGTLDCHLEASESIVNGDRDHLVQVIFNLLDNANKYSTPPAAIEIRTKNPPGTRMLEVSVSDQGVGIAPGRLEEIFDPFVRSGEIKGKRVKGFGLGLFYVRQILSLHQGTIHAASQTGKGSVFTIKLPLL